MSKKSRGSNNNVIRSSQQYNSVGANNRTMIEQDPKWLLQSTDSEKF